MKIKADSESIILGGSINHNLPPYTGVLNKKKEIYC